MKGVIHAKADEQVSRHMLNKRILRVLNELLEYEKREGRNPLLMITDKSAAQIVAETR
jgi:hypothetical protein